MPQFAVAVLFYCNHYDHVTKDDFSFEIFGFLITQIAIIDKYFERNYY